MYRILRSIKNRFGSTAELGIYEICLLYTSVIGVVKSGCTFHRQATQTGIGSDAVNQILSLIHISGQLPFLKEG